VFNFGSSNLKIIGYILIIILVGIPTLFFITDIISGVGSFFGYESTSEKLAKTEANVMVYEKIIEDAKSDKLITELIDIESASIVTKILEDNQNLLEKTKSIKNEHTAKIDKLITEYETPIKKEQTTQVDVVNERMDDNKTDNMVVNEIDESEILYVDKDLYREIGKVTIDTIYASYNSIEEIK